MRKLHTLVCLALGLGFFWGAATVAGAEDKPVEGAGTSADGTSKPAGSASSADIGRQVKELRRLENLHRYEPVQEQALALLQATSDEYSGELLDLYFEASTELNEPSIDGIFKVMEEELLPRHKDNPYFLRALALLYEDCTHRFKLDDGRYVRVEEYEQGGFSGAKRDRVTGLRLLLRAIELAKQQNKLELAGELQFETARMLFLRAGNRMTPGVFDYAGLSLLTDLERLPNYADLNDAPDLQNIEGLPMTTDPATGKLQPVFYGVPESWAAAKNDGERMQFLLQAAVESNKDLKAPVLWWRIDMAYRLFSYGNTVREQDMVYGPGNAGTVGGINPATLRDDQTVLATRLPANLPYLLVQLPALYDFIGMAKEIPLNEKYAGDFLNARMAAVEELLDRNRRVAAKELIETTLHEWQARNVPEKEMPVAVKRQLKALRDLKEQITLPNGRFAQDRRLLLAGKPQEIDFYYRNATSATVSMRKFDMKRWQSDRMQAAPVSSSAAYKVFEMFYGYDDGGSVLEKILRLDEYNKYLGPVIEGKPMTLTPGTEHMDQVAHVRVPTEQAGYYILTLTLENGYRFHRLVQLADTVLVTRTTPQGIMWFVADAVTGAPIADAQVDIVRYAPPSKNQKPDRYHLVTDAQGVAMEPKLKNKQNYYCLALASKGERCVSTIRRPSFPRDFAEGRKGDESDCVLLTSQPVYRPGQTARVKGVMYRQDFIKPSLKAWADKKLVLQIYSPRGEPSEYFEPIEVNCDEFGCFETDIEIPKQANTGEYLVFVWTAEEWGKNLKNKNRRGRLRQEANPVARTYLFEIEEYKKPEFFCTVNAPKEPVKTGEIIPVTIEAGYYAGGTLSQGKAHVRVIRTVGGQGWQPFWRWEWLYPTENVYCGGSAVHCVLDTVLTFNEQGVARLDIDTRQDARDFGSKTLRYRIEVTVSDATHKSVTQNAYVLADSKPFNVFMQLNRGYVNTGKIVQASIIAATVNGNKVATQGGCTLYRVNPENKREQVFAKAVEIDEAGEASVAFQVQQAGMYVLKTVLQAPDGTAVSEELAFQAYGPTTGAVYKDLEPLTLTPDKRVYDAGDTAHVLVSSRFDNAHVWVFPYGGSLQEGRRLIQLQEQHAVADCVLTKENMPQTRISAFTVHDGELFNAHAVLRVPPVNNVLYPTMSTNRTQYEPGQEGQITVTVKAPSGEPLAHALVTLAVYDKALEAIAGGGRPNIEQLIWAPEFEPMPVVPSEVSQGWCVYLDGKGQTDFAGLLGGGRVAHYAMRNERGMVMSYSPGADGMAMKATRVTESNGALPMDADEPVAEAGETMPALRENFADCIKWVGTVRTDEHGMVKVPFKTTDDLTTWKATAWVITPELQAGQVSAEFTVNKEVAVTLQAPRFLVQQDVVMLSALVRNQSKTEVNAPVSIRLPEQLRLLAPDSALLQGLHADARSQALTQQVSVPAGGQAIVHWWVQAQQAGEADITVTLTPDTQAGDAMKGILPVEVHGMPQTFAQSAILYPNDGVRELKVMIPHESQDRELTVDVSPSLALTMVQALPYVTEAEYACCDFILNRFMPALLVRKTLKELGLDPGKALQALQEQGESALDKRLGRNPIYNERELDNSVTFNLKQLQQQQSDSGGWNWCGGNGEGDPVMTARIVHGLHAIKTCADVPPDMLERGIRWLKRYQQKQYQLLVKGREYRQIEQMQDEREKQRRLRKLGAYRLTTDACDMFVYLTLAETGTRHKGMLDMLFGDRLELPMYAQLQLAQALWQEKQTDRYKELLPVIMQFLRQDDVQQTAWLHVNQGRFRWYWYANHIATQAEFLKMMTLTKPESELCARIAKWLVNNRSAGAHWDSNLSTAMCIEALAAYLSHTKEGAVDMTAEVFADGKPLKVVTVRAEDLFTAEHVVHVPAELLTPGEHTIEVRRKQGAGNIYANSTLRYFSLQNPIPAAGHALRATRAYYKIRHVKTGGKVDVQTDSGELKEHGQTVTERTLLREGDAIDAGDIIEVITEIHATNDVEYLICKDPKPAGCEPVDKNSGYVRVGHMSVYRELRDTHINMFIAFLPQGDCRYSYRLRAERPGRFSALPATIQAVYTPELFGNSAEQRISIAQPK